MTSVAAVGSRCSSEFGELAVVWPPTRFRILHPKLGPAQPASPDSLLGGLDQDRADAAGLQGRVDRQLHYLARARELGVVDPADRHRKAGRRAGGEIVHLAGPGAFQRVGDAHRVAARPGPAVALSLSYS